MISQDANDCEAGDVGETVGSMILIIGNQLCVTGETRVKTGGRPLSFPQNGICLGPLGPPPGNTASTTVSLALACRSLAKTGTPWLVRQLCVLPNTLLLSAPVLFCLGTASTLSTTVLPFLSRLPLSFLLINHTHYTIRFG